MPTVAAIDVGSTATRLLMAEVTPTGRLVDSEYHRYGVRLGADVFHNGSVTGPQMDELVNVFSEMGERMRKRGVQRYRAVGTAAMREAVNCDRVVSTIKQRSGLDLEIIDGTEEIRLSRQALLRAVGSVPHNAILVDLGGGTLEIERASGRGASLSLPLGTARLLERFPFLAQPLALEDVDEALRVVTRDLRRMTRTNKSARLAICTGGNLVALARLVPEETATLPSIDLGRLPEFGSRAARMSPEERALAFGLRRDRANLLIASVVILCAIAERYGVRSMVVPNTGLRESLLYQLSEAEHVAPGARAVLARLGQGVKGPERLARVSRQLFEALAPVHNLWRPALGALLTAAYLRGIGATIDPDNPSPHTTYIIRQSAGLGADQRSRLIASHAAAAVCAAPTRELRAKMSAPDVDVAQRIGALLRLAIAVTVRGAVSVRAADLMARPVVIDCNLPHPLERSELDPIELALGCRLTVV